MTAPETEVVETATKLFEQLREGSEDSDRNRRLPAGSLDALRKAGFLRAYVPTELGGLELDPVTFARVIEEVSLADSTAGWILATACTVDWSASRLSDEGADELYAAGPDVMGAGTFNPPMTAFPVEGGFTITGQNPLASGISDATWFLTSALVMDDGSPRIVNGQPEIRAVFLSADEGTIVPTWDSMGMRGSDSNDIAFNGTFVPSHRTISFPPSETTGSRYQGPLYRMPLMGACITPWATIGLALANSTIDNLILLAQGKVPAVSTSYLRERQSVQVSVGIARSAVAAAKALLYETLSEAWERAVEGEPPSVEVNARLMLAGTHAMQESARAVYLMWEAAGSSAIYERNPFSRSLRDISVLKQHAFVAQTRYATGGQVLLGLQADFPIVNF